MEKDGEWNDNYDFGSRTYNPALGRWFSLDPYKHKFPSLSPYSGFADNPIYFVDIKGEVIYDGKHKVVVSYDEQGTIQLKRENGETVSAEFMQHAGRVLGAMSATDIGKHAIDIWDKTPGQVRIKISPKNPGGRFASTTGLPESNSEITKSTRIDVVIFEGAIDANVEAYKSTDPEVNRKADRFGNLVDKDEALGAIGTHEAFHMKEEQMKQDAVTGTDEFTQDDKTNMPINSEVTFREQYRAKKGVSGTDWRTKYEKNRLGKVYKGLEKQGTEYVPKK